MPERPSPPSRQRSIVALAAYPLSTDYRSRLESALGCTPSYRTLTELRQLSLLGMLRELRALRADRLLLPFEDPAAGAILSLLAALAALTPARRLEIVSAELEFSPFGRHRAVGALLNVGWASIRGLLTALLCFRQVRRLNSLPLVPATRSDGDVVYLKTNLARGVKAGGSVGHIAGVANGFARQGLRVLLLSADETVMIDPAVEYVPVDLPSSFGLPRDVNQYLFHRRFTRRALEVGATTRVGFVYQRLSVGNYTGVLLSRRLGVPLVLEYNGSEVWVAKNWGYPLSFPRLATTVEEVCLRHAHLVVTVSDVLRDELVELGVEPERIVSYPNCIDPGVFDPGRFSERDRLALRARHGLPGEAVVVTFIGTFGQWHGVEIFARSIALLVDHHRDWLERYQVRFLLVGDGLKRAEVDAVLAHERYSRYFRLPGLVPQDQAPLHLAASDILVSPHVPNADGSRFFGSPTKLFEYMAMGKAIVASDLDQIGDVLRGSPRVSDLRVNPWLPAAGAAILVEPGEPQELADGVRLLVEHPDWRTRLGERARATALSTYTWNHHVAAILQALEATSSPLHS